jgi:hypothetical protein
MIAKAKPSPSRRSTTRAKPAAKKTRKTVKPAKRASGAFKFKLRMYRQGLGDFFLLSLPRKSGGEWRLLIDCGVIIGTPEAKPTMQKLVGQLKADVGGALDAIAVTHRHADHVSGFLQAQELFAQFTVGEVWVSWLENPRDKLGKQILGLHEKAEQALRASAVALGARGQGDRAEEITALMAFRGEELGAAGSTTLAAVNAAKSLGPLHYMTPGDAPLDLGDTGARLFVLGPPKDEKLLGRMDPSSANPETYGLTALAGLLNNLAPALGIGSDEAADDAAMPFGPAWRIPLDDKTAPEFFKTNYFGSEAWRRIDADWLGSANALALTFDKAVNNTSLVFAIELESGEVLLFAADAQVGNWLSWQNVHWDTADGAIGANDLLKRTIVYKVGHHFSHNATLKEMGLEEMTALQYAMGAVDEKMAIKKRWTHMPFPDLMTALDAHTAKRTVRSDRPIPPAAKDVRAFDGYYELTL